MSGGNGASIEELHRRYYAGLLLLAFRLVGERGLAEDLVQETYLTAFLKRRELTGHPNPAGWLYRTLYFKAERELGKSYRTELLFASPESLPRRSLPPEEPPLLEALPAGLTEEERELLTLRFEKGWDYASLADRWGITEAACRKRLSRLLKKCRAAMEEDEEND